MNRFQLIKICPLRTPGYGGLPFRAELYDRRKVTRIDSASYPLSRSLPTVFQCIRLPISAYSGAVG